MRVAIVSDIHGSLLALDAVISDLNRVSPDLVLQGGDLATTGPRPAEVVDRIRELGWPGVVGNTDELIWRLDQYELVCQNAPRLRPWLDVLFHTLGPWAGDRLGSERVAWLRSLPMTYRLDDVVLLHASPGNLWRGPMPNASDDELIATFDSLGARLVVYGHIHRPFVRQVAEFVVANSGSVGMPWDGDNRPSYVVIDDGVVSVRRVEYDLDNAERDLHEAGFPLSDWLARTLKEAEFRQPASTDRA